MSRYVLSITLVLAVTANLLVPQQIVRYRACCYDVNGKLALHLCGCQTDNKEPALSTKRRCCDPLITQLASRSIAPAVNEPASVKYDAHSEFTAEVPQAALLEISAAHARISVWDTGPPPCGDVLSLLSRLNI